MSDNRELVWAALEARALRLLEHAKEIEPRAGVRYHGSLWRLWHFPAFGPQTTWTVLTPGRRASQAAEPLVREVTWDRAADQQRVFETRNEAAPELDEAPTLRCREAVLTVGTLQDLRESGASLAVPLIGLAQTVGMDGEYFGLETYEVSPAVRVQWWCDGPVEWRHFTDWVAGVRTLLQRQLDHAG